MTNKHTPYDLKQMQSLPSKEGLGLGKVLDYIGVKY